METPTPNYGLAKPNDDGTDLMSAFDVWLNPNWDKLVAAPAPPSGTTLPTSGTYNAGDRFYKTDTKSIYILVCKDATWGWFWRPIQDALSPWQAIPTSALAIAGWTLNPVPANPAAIALDNRGRCYWRGVIGPTAGTIPRNSSQGVFGPLPVGIRPRERGAFMVGHETLAVNTTATSLLSYQAARVFISDDPAANQTVRCFGGTADFNRIHLAGIQYACGSGMFYTP